MIGSIIVLVILILLSGVFSSTEIAMFSLSELKIRLLVEMNVRNAKTLQYLREHTHKLLITILIGNNVVNIAGASMATALAINIFDSAAVGIATGVMTLLILVFGEIIPKAYATRYAKQIGLFMAPIIMALSKILTPLVWVFEKITKSVVPEDANEPQITEEEVRDLVKMSEEEGSIKQQEEEMIQNIFKLDDTHAVDVMTARPDVFALENNLKVKDVLKLIKEKGYSRVPVYEEDLDTVVGVLYAKDLLGASLETNINTLLRDPFFVPESKRVDNLLREFKQKKVHLAIVVNEHGTTVGVITIEDLIEEIVGEIYDETDPEEEAVPIKEIGPHNYIIEGKTEIDEVEKALKIKLHEKDSSTLSGFMMHQLKKVPDNGDSFSFGGFRFIVRKVESQRVEKVEIIKQYTKKEKDLVE